MASVVDICNLALSHLGDNATLASIDPPEGSMQAEHCARFYPVARDSMLELHDWKFATRRAPLAWLDRPSWNWQYAYAAPAQAIKFISVLPFSAGNDSETQQYETEADENGNVIILTNQEQATMRFIARVIDTTRFPPLFVDALAWLLASHLAGPIIKGKEGTAEARTCYSTFRLICSQAMTSDANQRKVTPEHKVDWMASR